MTSAFRGAGKGPVLLDGATGTNLQKGRNAGQVCPEQWITGIQKC